MASWREINEVGGTVVLRVISGAIAALTIFGLGHKLWRGGTISMESVLMFIGAISLFGGYAVFGSRLGFRSR